MSNHTVIDVEHLEFGQSRPYADTVYRSVIKAKKHGCRRGIWIPCLLTEDEAKQLARMFVHPFIDNPQWFEPTLKQLTPGNPNKNGKSAEWFVKITLEYTG